MTDKQELFELLCQQCIGSVENTPAGELVADMKKLILEEQFELYYIFQGISAIVVYKNHRSVLLR